MGRCGGWYAGAKQWWNESLERLNVAVGNSWVSSLKNIFRKSGTFLGILLYQMWQQCRTDRGEGFADALRVCLGRARDMPSSSILSGLLVCAVRTACFWSHNQRSAAAQWIDCCWPADC